MMNGDPTQWLLLPPGDVAISRQPLEKIPDGGTLASGRDVLVANQGYPFPWGSLPEAKNASRLWEELRLGIGGLIHDKWFVTSDGRFGGARNVPTILPGSLRSCLLYDGGKGSNAENEGFAVLKRTSLEEQNLYRRLQLRAAEHVAADRGAIIVSPIGEQKEVYLGFVGRCMICPNPELISFRQARSSLARALPDGLRELVSEYFPALTKDFSCYNIRLFPEWQGWDV
jgi:hypothetical protein